MKGAANMKRQSIGYQIAKVVVLLVLDIIIAWNVISLLNVAFADGYDCYVICNPDSYVNARSTPVKTAEIVGRYDCGDRMTTDGKERSGYLHLIDCSFEVEEAWISVRYVVYDEPEVTTFRAEITGSGRVCARRWIGGKRNCWLKPGQMVTVYAVSDEWCVTSKGFVQTQFVGVGE